MTNLIIATTNNKLWVLILLAILVSLLWNLGAYDLTAPDEPRFALVAKEFLEYGHWFQAYRNEYAYPDKPPFFFWIIAFISLFFGEVNAWSSRLPSALSAIGILILLYRFIARENKERAVLAVFLMITTWIFYYQARMAQIDMLLSFFVCWAFMEVYSFMNGDHKRILTLSVVMGLGIISKGPIALLLPLGTAVLYKLMNKELSWKDIPWQGFAFALVIPFMWIIGLIITIAPKDEWWYLQNILYKQTAVRYLNPWHHYKPFYYFLKTILHDGFPWVFFMFLAIPFSKEKIKKLDGKILFSWCVIIFTIVFFSLSSAKRNLYILPLFPFMIIVVSHYLMDWMNSGKPHKVIKVYFYILSGLFFLVSIILMLLMKIDFILGIIKKVRSKTNIEILSDCFSNFPFTLAFFMGLILSFLAVTLFSFNLKRKSRSVVYVLIISLLVVHLTINILLMPWLNQYRTVRPFMEAVTKEIKNESSPVLGMVDFRSEFRLYGNQHIIELLDAEGKSKNGNYGAKVFWEKHANGWLIIRRKHWEKIIKKNPLNRKVVFSKIISLKKEYLLIH